MPYMKQERVYRMIRSAHRLLHDAQRESEQMVDQTLAEDLLYLSLRLSDVVRAAERNRYRRPASL